MYFSRIRDLREYSGFKRNEIADYLGVQPGTYYRYEKGLLEISSKRLIKLAKMHNVSCDYIVNLMDELGTFSGESRVPIWKRLKHLRLKNNLREEDVAKYLIITQSNYSHYETGLRDMPIELLIKLAQFYHVTMDYLLLGAGEENPILKKLDK